MQEVVTKFLSPNLRILLKGFLYCVALIAFSSAIFAQQPQKTVNWDSWQFLLGEWKGKGGGGPGQGSGNFGFSLDLQKQILIRRNHSEYPATKDRAAYSHDDLMVIYQEPDILFPSLNPLNTSLTIDSRIQPTQNRSYSP
jgi:hypothetical protein